MNQGYHKESMLANGPSTSRCFQGTHEHNNKQNKNSMTSMIISVDVIDIIKTYRDYYFSRWIWIK